MECCPIQQPRVVYPRWYVSSPGMIRLTQPGCVCVCVCVWNGERVWESERVCEREQECPFYFFGHKQFKRCSSTWMKKERNWNQRWSILREWESEREERERNERAPIKRDWETANSYQSPEIIYDSRFWPSVKFKSSVTYWLITKATATRNDLESNSTGTKFKLWLTSSNFIIVWRKTNRVLELYLCSCQLPQGRSSEERNKRR